MLRRDLRARPDSAPQSFILKSRRRYKQLRANGHWTLTNGHAGLAGVVLASQQRDFKKFQKQGRFRVKQGQALTFLGGDPLFANFAFGV